MRPAHPRDRWGERRGGSAARGISRPYTRAMRKLPLFLLAFALPSVPRAAYTGKVAWRPDPAAAFAAAAATGQPSFVWIHHDT